MSNPMDDLFADRSADTMWDNLAATADTEADLLEEEAILNLEPPIPDDAIGEDVDTDEEVAAIELSYIEEGFRARLARESDRLKINNYAEFYVCVVFATMEQRDTWLAARGFNPAGRRYIDGRAVAAADGIELPPTPEFPRVAPPHRDLTDLALTWEEYEALGENE